MFISKKTRIVLACLCAVALISFAIYQKNKSEIYVAPQQPQYIAIENSLKDSSLSDSDGDGLKNWEETLWKTDAQNPDTDGDGTPDGVEVGEKRDPTKKAPDDSLEVGDISASRTEAQANLTPSDKFSQEFFARYALLKQSGSISNPQVQTNLINDLLNSDLIQLHAPQYSLSDIPIQTTETEASLRLYGNTMGQILAKYKPAKPQDEIAIFESALANDSETELLKLTPILTYYESVKKDFFKVSVPRSLAGEHVMFINSLETIIASLKTMQKVFDDPFTAFAGLREYETASTNLQNAHQNIKDLFFEKNISFQQFEDGYAFAHSI